MDERREVSQGVPEKVAQSAWDQVTMGRVLIITPFEIFPPYWGAANRAYNIARCISTDHEVTLLSVRHQQLDVAPGVDDPLLHSENIRLSNVPSLTKYSQIFNPLLILKGLILACGKRYSLILAETGWSGLHAMLLSFITRVPYVLDEHNVEWVAFKRMNRVGRLSGPMLRQYERMVCRFAHKILCVSEEDGELLASELNVERNKIVVIPNGVDMERFRPDENARNETRQMLGVPENTPLILFNGKLDYRPNYEAVDIIFRDIMPGVLGKVPDAKFLIVGSNPPLEFSHDSLIFTNTVDRIEDYINATDVVICPLRSGGGTRFKILEAIACGKPVISTTIGAEGLIGEETESHLRCIDDWDQFVIEVINAIHADHDARLDDSFIRKYSWTQVAQALKTQVFP